MVVSVNFTNSVHEYSVSEISSKIKHIIEQGCGYVRVRGEISGLKIATSGHGYFNIKDNDALLASTCWRPTLSKLTFTLEEGMEIVASGRITTYMGQSKYQLSVDKIEPAGVGALMQILVQRKIKLEQEGLFDKARKKKIPFLPQKIGIITSITGAVIQDMLHRIRDRCPVNVVIWPTTVQGDTAANEITAAIRGFNNIESIKPDLIIIARGGGSIEDLWAFNEEIVVRAVAESTIPIISAVGHETDFTLTDFAADVRAPTPTAAAEFSVPVLTDLKISITQSYARLKDILYRLIEHKTKIILLCSNILGNPMKLIRHHEQALDYLIFKISDRLPQMILNKSMQLENLSSKISDPNKILSLKKMQMSYVSGYINKSIENILSSKTSSLTLQKQLLQTLDYKNVLKRGFSIVRYNNNVMTSSEKLHHNDQVTITMHDGIVCAKIIKQE